MAGDHLHEQGTSTNRSTLVEAADAFVSVVEQVPAGGWTQPALGVWDVRALVGHTLRAFVTIEEYLGPPSGPGTTIEIDSAPAYYRAVMTQANLHAGVAERGREAGAELGDDPVAVATATATRVLALVEAAPDDAVITSRGGTMGLEDFLATRIVELAVHTLDLTDALGIPPSLPTAVAEAAAGVLVCLAGRVDGGEAALLRALTGRGTLPPGFNVLA